MLMERKTLWSVKRLPPPLGTLLSELQAAGGAVVSPRVRALDIELQGQNFKLFLESQWPVTTAYFHPILGYLRIWWPVVSGYLAVHVVHYWF